MLFSGGCKHMDLREIYRLSEWNFNVGMLHQTTLQNAKHSRNGIVRSVLAHHHKARTMPVFVTIAHACTSLYQANDGGGNDQ